MLRILLVLCGCYLLLIACVVQTLDPRVLSDVTPKLDGMLNFWTLDASAGWIGTIGLAVIVGAIRMKNKAKDRAFQSPAWRQEDCEMSNHHQTVSVAAKEATSDATDA